MPYFPPSAAGTSFPLSPGTNDRFYRTDRGLEYYYDGTRWLSTQLFTVNAQVNNIDVTTNVYVCPSGFGQYNLWAVSVESAAYRSTAVGEWDIIVTTRTAAEAVDSTLATVDGFADETNTWSVKNTAVGTLINISTAKGLMFAFTEISGTSTLTAGAVLSYRLVG